MKMVYKTRSNRFAISWAIYVAACLARTGMLHAQGTSGVPQHKFSGKIKVDGSSDRPRPVGDAPAPSMSPFPIFSKQAQALKYPPGVDTVVYWDNGRFSIAAKTLYDHKQKGERKVLMWPL